MSQELSLSPFPSLTDGTPSPLDNLESEEEADDLPMPSAQPSSSKPPSSPATEPATVTYLENPAAPEQE